MTQITFITNGQKHMQSNNNKNRVKKQKENICEEEEKNRTPNDFLMKKTQKWKIRKSQTHTRTHKHRNCIEYHFATFEHKNVGIQLKRNFCIFDKTYRNHYV